MRGRIRLTRPGAHALGLGALTLWAALASGNNLLYLVYGLVASAFVVQWALLRWTLRGLSARAAFPEAVRQGAPFSVEVRAANPGRREIRGLRVVRGPEAAGLGPLRPGSEAAARLEAVLPQRGWNSLEGLCLESGFPFALLSWSAPLPARGLALPRPLDGASLEEIESVCEASGVERPKRGGGDELYGMRPYAPGDEARLINWKLSLRSGRTFVNEFSEPAGAKVTVRVEEGEGPAAERRAAAAAAALERCAGSGAEFRLALRAETTPFGTGRGHLLSCLEALAKSGAGGAARPAPPPAGRAQALPAGDARLDDLTRLGSLLVYLGLFLIDDIEVRLLAACAPAFVLSWAMSRRLLPRLPEAVWTPVSAAVLVFSLAVDWRASGVTLANTHLLVYMLVNRLLCRLEPVDLRQTFFIHFLAFFLVSGQTISPWYFPFFLAYAAYAAAWLALASSPPVAPARFVPHWPALGTLGLAALFFALTPRIEPLRQTNPFVKLGLDKRKPSAQFAVGFTENVSLGFFGQLKRSSARVMRVKPLGGWGDAPPGGGPPRPALMVRGAAFDVFDGRRWSKSSMPLTIRQGGRLRRTDGKAWAERGGPKRLTFPGAGRAVGPGIEVTLYPLNSAVVFTAAGLSHLESGEPAAWFDHTDTAYFAAPYLSGTSYRAWGRPRPTGFGSAIAEFEALLDGPYLHAPGGDARVARLAAELTRGAATPIEKIRAVAAGLREGYRYSTFSDDPERDLSGFLFSARSGNCEYFATAAAVLLRHAGVPTRLVAGFLADEWNEYGGFYDVRQGQAHAWVEAWTGEGWATVDATPPAGAGRERAFRAMGKLQRWLTAAQLRWYRDVIGFDSFVQRDALRRARLAVARRRLADAAESSWPYVKAALLAAAAGLAVLGLVPLVRRSPPRRFAAAERLLSESGFPRRPDQTAREYAASVAAERPDFAAAGPLAELHYRELYDPRGLEPSAAVEGDRLLAELRAAVYNRRRR